MACATADATVGGLTAQAIGVECALHILLHKLPRPLGRLNGMIFEFRLGLQGQLGNGVHTR